MRIIDLKNIRLNEGSTKVPTFVRKKFLSENFKVAKSFLSGEKNEKVQICQNAPTPLSVSLIKSFLRSNWGLKSFYIFEGQMIKKGFFFYLSFKVFLCRNWPNLYWCFQNSSNWVDVSLKNRGKTSKFRKCFLSNCT